MNHLDRPTKPTSTECVNLKTTKNIKKKKNKKKKTGKKQNKMNNPSSILARNPLIFYENPLVVTFTSAPAPHAQ